ncbi:toxin [Pseudomonas phage Littlefix]|uniref:Uncharacterized protein n=1 Tax=Pseudomonas phage Littlefix TaxID=2079289 RepID=A0A2K9VHN0_9CAUD|nr:toxin [Pseudomonas phage Littlefix]AUV61861.1 hypothetical protein PsPhLittlefix_gp46 [Pseudomonas phage Littlefix]
MAVAKKGATRTTSTQAAQGNQWEKASAFLNISLPTAGGDNVRVDSIKLKESNVVHAQIISKLSDPALSAEERAEKLKALTGLLIIDFQVVRSDEEKELVDF